jgi:hypothetical protein
MIQQFARVFFVDLLRVRIILKASRPRWANPWSPSFRIGYMFRKTLCFLALIAAAFSLAPRESSAVPILQIYVEGATYDIGTETWVLEGSGTPIPLRLWVIGNTSQAGSGPNPYAPIVDVKLAAAYLNSDVAGPLSISLGSSTTGGYGGFVDPSVSAAVAVLGTHTDGSSPTLGDGSSLPSHGVYGVGTTWQEFGLGDFNFVDSIITDFNGADASPSPGGPAGQINVYDVTISGLADGGSVHFDVYDHVIGKKGKITAFNNPFSHDGEGGFEEEEEVPPVTPEPASLAIWGGIGLAGLVVAWRRKRSQASKLAA